MAILDGAVRAVRDIPAGTVLDHAFGSLVLAETRANVLRAIRTKNNRKTRDADYICVPLPARYAMTSRDRFAYFDTHEAGTRFIELILMDPNQQPNVRYARYGYNANDPPNDMLIISSISFIARGDAIIGPHPLDGFVFPDDAGLRLPPTRTQRL